MSIIVTLFVLAVVGGAGFWFYQQQQGGGIEVGGGSSASDRYVTEVVIDPAHLRLLQYLQEAYSERVVLYRPSLSQLVTARNAANWQRAHKRIEELFLDFVVLTPEGKADVAFEVRERGAEEDNAAKRSNAIKKRVLETADVKLLRIQRSVSNLPDPADFREKMDGMILRKELKAKQKFLQTRADLQQPSDSPSSPAPLPQNGTEVSEIANLSDLMDLPPDNSEPKK